MGDFVQNVTWALLIFIVIRLVANRRRNTIVIDGKRISLKQNLFNHLEWSAVAIRDVDFAERLLKRPNGMSWTEACQRLAEHGSNPALAHLREVTSEAQAEDMFRTALAMLIQVRDKAEENLDLARSLVPDGQAEDVMGDDGKNN